MATRNIVPRATGEGGLGTAAKKWALGWINALVVATLNALTLTAQAIGFTISGGSSSSMTLTVSGNAEVGQAFTTPEFDAGNFTASGSMIWTVEAADVVNYSYIILGKIMIVTFSIISSTVGGTPSDILQIKIPASKTASGNTAVPIYLLDNGVRSVGFASLWGTSIDCYKVDVSNWTASTNATRVSGQAIIEIN